jgi:peptidyl-prolyl cis-trans isomerase B (cyclophilin B)
MNVMVENRQPEVFEAVKDVDLEKNDYLIALNTSHGRILLDLLADDAPGHCLNMIGLAKIGYYDGVGFHRIISGFMIQGGCPSGTGTGGPGYTIKAEFNSRPHVPGVLSMARTSDPDSAGSQFFICLETVPHLDNQYTAFGKTADDASLEVIRAIGAISTDAGDKPSEPVVIETAKVIERPKP